MAENARNGANGGSGVGGAGDDPPRRNSNMNGNRASVRFGGSEPVGKKLALSQRGSNATDTTDEEAKLLQQQQQQSQSQFKVAPVKGGGTDVGVDSGGGGGEEDCAENGDLVKGKDGIEVSVIDIAEGAGGGAAGAPFKPGKSKKGNAVKGE